MIYSLVRPLLFKKDAEEAHHLGMRVARGLAGWPWGAEVVHKWLARPASIKVEVAGLTFPNPVGLAAGMDKNGEAALAWWAFGFGFMELGTVTPKGQEGKPKPRLFRYPEKAAVVNRMGFNNEGADAVASRLAFQKRSGCWPTCPVGISVGKNLATPAERAVEDYEKATAKVAAHADYLAINVSSPNTPGLRDLQSGAEVSRLVKAVKVAAGKPVPVFVKIAPELAGEALADVVTACGEAGAAGIIATNTLSTKGMEGLEEGGLSGRPLREISPRKVEEVRKLVGDSMAIIGCGGVEDVGSATRMLNAGADLIQVYTGLIYEGPFLPARLTRDIARVWRR
jgi:dihydroorotate dehydrogenase